MESVRTLSIVWIVNRTDSGLEGQLFPRWIMCIAKQKATHIINDYSHIIYMQIGQKVWACEFSHKLLPMCWLGGICIHLSTIGRLIILHVPAFVIIIATGYGLVHLIWNPYEQHIQWRWGYTWLIIANIEMWYRTSCLENILCFANRTQADSTCISFCGSR